MKYQSVHLGRKRGRPRIFYSVHANCFVVGQKGRLRIPEKVHRQDESLFTLIVQHKNSIFLNWLLFCHVDICNTTKQNLFSIDLQQRCTSLHFALIWHKRFYFLCIISLQKFQLFGTIILFLLFGSSEWGYVGRENLKERFYNPITEISAWLINGGFSYSENSITITLSHTTWWLWK